MNSRLLIVLLLLVAIPFLLMGWLGAELARREQLRAERQVDEFLHEQLYSSQVRITEITDRVERELLTAMNIDDADRTRLRSLVSDQRYVVAAFAIAADGTRVHPPASGETSDDEKEFLLRTQEMWRDDPLATLAGPPQEIGDTQKVGQDTPSIRRSGWYVWYWGDGQHFLFWRRTPGMMLVGVEVNRSALLAEVLAALPDTDPLDDSLAIRRISLVDPHGRSLYQWGLYEPPESSVPRVTWNLAEPFSAWQLENHVPATLSIPAASFGTRFQLWSGMGVVGISLIGLAVYFYRESSRAMRDAAQRVSFVNQVSHELRTPLTNIRLYGELLQANLDSEDERSVRYLGVIASESQRLSRLIGNILTFGRRLRAVPQLQHASGEIDTVIGSALEQFLPMFEARGFVISIELNATGKVMFDADAVQQILGNLFSNVEKYAAAGKFLKVTSSRSNGITQIDVSDRGPGIPPTQRGRIFEPFVRLSEKVSDGTAGTGIGLSIARDLARLHGGDLLAIADTSPGVSESVGASFRLTLATPGTSEDSSRLPDISENMNTDKQDKTERCEPEALS